MRPAEIRRHWHADGRRHDRHLAAAMRPAEIRRDEAVSLHRWPTYIWPPQ